MKTRPNYFHHPAEEWDAKRCAKEARHIQTDGLGTPYPFRGACPYVKDNPVTYNGGCIREEEWYRGETFELPKLAKGFEWRYVPTWCWQIVKV